MPHTPGEEPSRAQPDRSDEGRVRSVLEAAAARPDELPDLAPFFAARVVAVARARDARRPQQLVASAAWHALPALAVLVALLSLLAGIEIGRDADAQEDVAMVVLQSREAGPDAPLATLLLAGPSDSPTRGGSR